ncbi:putative Fcf2 pre-rRNA processing [Helianthus anomalus]
MFVYLSKQTEFLVRVCLFIKRTNTNELPVKWFMNCLLNVRFVCSPSCFASTNFILRNVINPKRHYKKGDSKLNTFPKYFQVGTVVEPVSEYFTSRLTRKERKPTLADELLSDKSLKDYR